MTLRSILLIAALLTTANAQPARIEIIDQENGWPVPLIQLRTTDSTTYISDNAGLIAIQDPDRFGHPTWFHLEGHGYTLPKDGFGYQGVKITLISGEKTTIRVQRANIAKRLGRLTGSGRFINAAILGETTTHTPDTGVSGCDSVLMSRYGDRLFWLWGDTILPDYPLGIYHSTAATTDLTPITAYQPPLDIPYQYFRHQNGRPRPVATMPGEGPTWLTAMTYTGPADTPDALVATYTKIKNHLQEYEIGLCKWDPATTSFQHVSTLWKEGQGDKPAAIPRGHPVHWTDPTGKPWLLFGDPFPTLRCPDTYAAWHDPGTWETIDAPATLTSRHDASPIRPHRGSIAWSTYKKRWITIFTQHTGTPSAFGEIWYAEADAPTGPWTTAVKILTHDNYTFYNPRIHPELTPPDAPFILFEGTYTAEFADHATPTPRYNYNQILYRLDFDDIKP